MITAIIVLVAWIIVCYISDVIERLCDPTVHRLMHPRRKRYRVEREKRDRLRHIHELERDLDVGTPDSRWESYWP